MTQPEAPAAVAPLALSSRDVARLLGVGEATVKRWADDGRLECRKTPGGHRRFTLSSIAAFRRKWPASDLRWPTSPEVARKELLQKALAGEGEELTRLVLAGIDEGLPIESLCDDWLSPMLVEIGSAWEAGQLAIAQEHIASAAVSEMMSQVAPFLTHVAPKGAALTGCLPQERHDLGARMAGLVLRSESFRVVHVGADTPLHGLMEEADKECASVIALGGQLDHATSHASLTQLGLWASERGVRVFAGGKGFSGEALPSSIEWVGTFAALKKALKFDGRPPRGLSSATPRRTFRIG